MGTLKVRPSSGGTRYPSPRPTPAAWVESSAGNAGSVGCEEWGLSKFVPPADEVSESLINPRRVGGVIRGERGKRRV
ncbi:MAG: hypothetical protein RIS56_2302 [Verrucomicrobiota bacterium]